MDTFAVVMLIAFIAFASGCLLFVAAALVEGWIGRHENDPEHIH